MKKVIVWGENVHEKRTPRTRELYPRGMHTHIAEVVAREPTLDVGTATLDEKEHGLPASRVGETDVLVWWGHIAHDQVRDEVVDRIVLRVNEGMGLIVLHSAHFSKVFKRLMGTTCSLSWREAAERERLWNIAPTHPITRGIGECIELEQAEMYGEPFAIPDPDELIFLSWFQGGEVFRSGATWRRGHGKIFYFRPGHETYPVYHHPDVQRVLCNAVLWAAADGFREDRCPMVANPREPL